MVQTERTGSALPRTSTTPATNAAERQSVHTVRRGDTLTDIARDHGLSVEELIAANPQIRNPNLIHAGQDVRIPQPGSTSSSSSPSDAIPASGPPARRPTGSPVPIPNNGGLSADTLRSYFDPQANGLQRGARGPEVETLQRRLAELGYPPAGGADGVFGRNTQRALQDFQRSQSLDPDGIVGDTTRRALDNPTRPQPVNPNAPPGESAPRLQRYEPGSPEQVALFREAARLAGVPESWAESPGLQNILRRESGGRVGIPNYTYGDRARDPSQWGAIHDELRNGRITARSSATGLGQLLLSNVDRYYPNGRAGIGDPVQEAAGMMAYIKDRYGNPERAWAQYNTRHEGY